MLTKTKIAFAVALSPARLPSHGRAGLRPKSRQPLSVLLGPGRQAQPYIGTAVPRSAPRSIASRNVAPARLHFSPRSARLPGAGTHCAGRRRRRRRRS